MTQNISLPRSYNVMALRGGNIDDMEYVEMFGLDPAVAYTPEINNKMLDITYQQNIDAGLDEKQATANRIDAEKNIKRLLASNGMLK